VRPKYEREPKYSSRSLSRVSYKPCVRKMPPEIEISRSTVAVSASPKLLAAKHFKIFSVVLPLSRSNIQSQISGVKGFPTFDFFAICVLFHTIPRVFKTNYVLLPARQTDLLEFEIFFCMYSALHFRFQFPKIR
jgi:hypothetical protein